MIRKIIKIDKEKCNGCGVCASACHEGAIGMVEGRARLLRDDFCDGLGNCLPACPTGAITIEEREAAEYDEAAVKARSRGCPGIFPRVLPDHKGAIPSASMLSQWPVQIKLAPVSAAYFSGADLLIAADCSAYACGDFHTRFMKKRIVLIGCPKLDACDYAEKLTEIFKKNSVKSLVVARMEAPCCGGIEKAVLSALHGCGKDIPLRVAVIATDGKILS